MRRRRAKILAAARRGLAVGPAMAWASEGRVASRTEELDRLNQQLQNEIHQKRLAQHALKQSEAKYRSIIENATEGIFQTSPEGRLIMVNQSLAELFGYASPEESKQRISDIRSQLYADPGQREIFKRTIEANGRVRGFEARLRRKDGTVLEALINAHVVKDGVGNTAYYEGMLQDITERKRSESMRIAKEAAEAANRAKSAFLANMSHEIRTPMNAIIGLSELALKTRMSAQQHDYLNKIHGSAVALLGIINDILDISKIEAGKLELECTGFDLEALLDQLVDMSSVMALQKRLELLVFIEPAVPRWIKADPLRLGQVLINLTSNALKFTEKGEVIVRVSLVSKENGKIRLVFSVRDSGAGISPEYLSQLGTSFSQADPSTTRRHGGTGLGLAISRQLIELMQGRLTVSSTPGAGSEFSFTIDCAESTEPAEAPPVEGFFPGKRALVVDDNARCREIFSEMLESLGIVATTADSGRSAMDAIQKAMGRPFDLVLLDGSMPGMDGIETLDRLRDLPGMHDTPLVLTSDGERESELIKAQAAGIRSFLIKPVKQSVFRKTVASTLSAISPESPETAAGGPIAERCRFMGDILIVEDMRVNRQVAVELSQNLGLRVKAAENGKRALEMLSRSAFDLVLMDVQMPDMDGLTVTRRIRANPRFEALPIVAMTAHALSGSREICLAAGMNDVIHKPIETHKLTEVFRRWLKPAQCLPAGPANPPDVWDMPEKLPGIDLDAARLRFPNAQFFRSLLFDFAHRHHRDIAALRDAVLNADNQKARFLVHGLIGVAKSICARDLHMELATLESRISDGPMENLDPGIERLGRVMDEVLMAIGTLGPSEGSCEASASDAPLDLDALRRSLDRLADRLGANSLEAESIFNRIMPQLTRVLSPERAARIRSLIEKLEYRAAREAIGKIAEGL